MSLANKSLTAEFGFTRAQLGSIITTALLAYAFGLIINGLLTDRLGGKRAMLIGAAGTIVMNTLFGAVSAFGLLGLFVAVRGIDGYMQSFGAPGMVKINTAWFGGHVGARRFSGIFGFMINLGRVGILPSSDPLCWRAYAVRPALGSGFALEMALLSAFHHLRGNRDDHGFGGEGDARGSGVYRSRFRHQPLYPQTGDTVRRRCRGSRSGCAFHALDRGAHHCRHSRGLDYRLRLCLHGRGAASRGPVVPALHGRMFTTWI